MDRLEISEELKQDFQKAYLMQPPRAERVKWLEDNKTLACTNCKKKGIRCVAQSGPRAGAGCVACLHRGGHEAACSRLLEERKARVMGRLKIPESKFNVLYKWYEELRQGAASAAKKAKIKERESTKGGEPGSAAAAASASTSPLSRSGSGSARRSGTSRRIEIRRSSISTSSIPKKSTVDFQEEESEESDPEEPPPVERKNAEVRPPRINRRSKPDTPVVIPPGLPESVAGPLPLEAEIAKIIAENECLIEKCDELLLETRNPSG